MQAYDTRGMPNRSLQEQCSRKQGANARLVQPHIQALQLAHVGQVLAHQVGQLLPLLLPTLPAIMAAFLCIVTIKKIAVITEIL